MELKEFREEAWGWARDFGDRDSERLWTTAEMNRYINRVYRKIATDTLCIRDSVTPEVCIIQTAPVDYTTYTVGTQDYIWANDEDSWLYQQDVAPYLYDLHKTILRVDEVKWTYRPWKLRKVSVSKWQENPWWEQVKGPPTEFATDLSNKKIALNFRDTATDALRLVVRRLPLTDLILEADEPEFRDIYHDRFLNGVLAQMYLKHDTETYNKGKSDEHQEMFLQDLDEIKQMEIGLEQTLGSNGSLLAFR